MGSYMSASVVLHNSCMSHIMLSVIMQTFCSIPGAIQARWKKPQAIPFEFNKACLFWQQRGVWKKLKPA